MLIPLKEVSRIIGKTPTGVVHVGAHKAEEMDGYENLEWVPVVWIEANPNLIPELKEMLELRNATVEHAAVWSVSGKEIEFNIASNSQSSSMYEFGTHLKSYPNIIIENKIKIKTKTLDEILEKYPNLNFLNMDIQGAELEALKGLGKKIEQINYIYTEINSKNVYEGCATVKELDLYLSISGFTRISTRWVIPNGWGDALYIRNEIRLKLKLAKFKNIMKLIHYYAYDFPFILKRIIEKYFS
jgi:FkbM family methyltransferase